ncbi:hypothetical protein [Sphingobium subterraneum]|nr:hypothetical protein [Sphingobium subterraneum]
MEYQARQARDIGVGHVLLLVDVVTPALSRTVDALSADGMKVQLIRDMATLVRDVPRDSDVVLFADGAIADQRYIDMLAQGSGNIVLVAEDSGSTGHFERIDGIHRWVGVARIAPDVLFGTLDLIGDWDFSLTLLRAAVQAGAKRVTVNAADVLDGRVALVDRQDTANLVAQALLAPASVAQGRNAGAEHYLLAPVAGMLTARLVRMQIPAGRARVGAGGLALFGLLMVYPGWLFVAGLVFLAALTANLVADQLSEMGRRKDGDGWLALVPVLIVLPGLVAIGAYGGRWDAALYLALMSLVILLAVRRGLGGAMPRWAALTPGSALVLLLIGLMLASEPTLVLLATLCAIFSIGRLLLQAGKSG